MSATRQIEFYQSPNGQTEVQVTFDNDNVWLNQEQIGQLFDRDRTVIGRHIRSIFQEGELTPEMVCADFAHTTEHGAIKGKTQSKNTKYYNLDVIISVGYRVKSPQGTRFRQWATKRLQDFLLQGYALNQKRLEQKNQQIKVLKSGIQILSRTIEQTVQHSEFEWLERFAKGLSLLDDYDHERLDGSGLSTREARYPTKSDYQAVIDEMKRQFGTGVFGVEKDQSFNSSIAQISKGFGELDFYPSIEEKAATLLYLVIKNHSFADGNKRIAAACFLLFLEKNDALVNSDGSVIVSNEALASITLFAAASEPHEMNVVKRLIVSVLNRNKR